MAIRIPFAAETPPQLRFESSPLSELALGIHKLVDPHPSVRYAAFARRMRARLPRPLVAEARELSLVLAQTSLPQFVFPADGGADVRAAIAGQSPRDPVVQAPLTAALEWPITCDASARTVRELERDPAAVAERLLALLRAYWEHAFEEEWTARLEARLALARVELELVLRRGGIGAVLGATTRRARLSGDGIVVTPRSAVDATVAVDEAGTLRVVLSAFSHRWVITRLAPTAALVLPTPSRDATVTPPSIELVQELDALAEPTRLTMLRLLADRPRSTRELAELLEVSEAAVSKHLRRLAGAGLVAAERRGYYVLYRLLPERAAAASRSLLDFLRVASDSPAG